MCGALSEKGDAGERARLRRGAARRRSRRAAARAAGAARLPRQLDARRARGAGRRLPPAAAAAGRARRSARCFLELCTPRAGELDVLRRPAARRAASASASSTRSIDAGRAGRGDRRAGRGARSTLFGAERVLLTPDCGFATFADNPVASAAHRRGQAARARAGAPRSSAAGERQAARQRARSIPYTRAGWPNSSVWPRKVSPSRSATRIDGSLPGRMRLMRWSRPSSVNA